ncbi:hypothetical protein P1X15_05185 [Runella sp. MFBS21]|uniref:hypothetical protein n=1 Tax=Runella sp. MFBS21 TaxID=3034018 RepID=UPI0023F9A128|nr:hypothetical protein [Runella sp. MFBS21]MDF7816975.1 hypothetical protein [Runella sp. MFBS21]
MVESIVISNKPPLSLASDYTQLRALGMAYIEHLGSEFWTDYNTHDPGITTLHLLCYAITDLSLRTQLPIEDILTSSLGSQQALREAFLTADMILPTSPVTELDYRKLLIDVEGVRNAWLLKAEQRVYVNCQTQHLQYETPLAAISYWTDFALQGLYDLLIEYDEVCFYEKEANAVEECKKNILKNVKNAYLENRCLGEDIRQIKEVPAQKIMICADVDIENDVNVAEVHARILFEIQHYLSPPIKRYSLQELQAILKQSPDQEVPFDVIFEGPLLQNGFILDTDLEAAQLRARVYTSDIINKVMGIELNGKKAVKAIKKIRLNLLIKEEGTPCKDWKPQDPEGVAWCLHIPEGHQAQLCIEKTALNFFKNGILVSSTTHENNAYTQFRNLQKEFWEANKRTIEVPLIPVGEVQAVEEYSSIVNDFPQTYGIGREGLPASTPLERQAKAKQFKAYLLFFDQLLANYLAQIKNLSKLFDPASEAGTYFSQKITDVKEVELLYGNYAQLDDTLALIIEKWEGYPTNPIRKNRFLDHILARFAENFSEYAMLSFSLFEDFDGTKILKNKSDFIKNFYQRPSRDGVETSENWHQRSVTYFRNLNHAHAYNYCQSVNGTPSVDNPLNITGVVRRIAGLLGISESEAQLTVSATDERIFLVEHILLRPDVANPAEKWFEVCTEPDCTHCRPLDPYSFRVSVVLPGYTERFSNISFRKYAERVIRKELPAHILARICWVSQSHLEEFVNRYKVWLELKSRMCEAPDLQAYALAFNELLEILHRLHTIYPEGVLHNCDNPDEKSPLILGRSVLGSLKNQ